MSAENENESKNFGAIKEQKTGHNEGSLCMSSLSMRHIKRSFMEWTVTT